MTRKEYLAISHHAILLIWVFKLANGSVTIPISKKRNNFDFWQVILSQAGIHRPEPTGPYQAVRSSQRTRPEQDQNNLRYLGPDQNQKNGSGAGLNQDQQNIGPWIPDRRSTYYWYNRDSLGHCRI